MARFFKAKYFPNTSIWDSPVPLSTKQSVISKGHMSSKKAFCCRKYLFPIGKSPRWASEIVPLEMLFFQLAVGINSFSTHRTCW